MGWIQADEDNDWALCGRSDAPPSPKYTDPVEGPIPDVFQQIAFHAEKAKADEARADAIRAARQAMSEKEYLRWAVEQWGFEVVEEWGSKKNIEKAISASLLFVEK